MEFEKMMDIDHLLEISSYNNNKEDELRLNIKKIEIDRILELTRDWN